MKNTNIISIIILYCLFNIIDILTGMDCAKGSEVLESAGTPIRQMVSKPTHIVTCLSLVLRSIDIGRTYCILYIEKFSFKLKLIK